MNFTPRSTLFTLVGTVGLTFGFSACETGSTDYSGRAQTSMVADTVPGTSGRTGLAVEGGGMPAGIGRYAGHYYYIRHGSATRLLQRQRLPDGYTYEGKGRIVSGDGNVIRLSEREMVTFAGDRMRIPANVTLP